VIVPLALLALAAVDVIQLRDDGVSWGRGIVVGLGLLTGLAVSELSASCEIGRASFRLVDPQLQAD